MKNNLTAAEAYLPAEAQEVLERALAPPKRLKKWFVLVEGLIELFLKAEIVREVGPGLPPERQDDWQKKKFGPIL